VWGKSERFDLFFGKNAEGIDIANVVATYDTWLTEQIVTNIQLQENDFSNFTDYYRESEEQTFDEDYLEGYDSDLLLHDDDD